MNNNKYKNTKNLKSNTLNKKSYKIKYINNNDNISNDNKIINNYDDKNKNINKFTEYLRKKSCSYANIKKTLNLNKDEENQKRKERFEKISQFSIVDQNNPYSLFFTNHILNQQSYKVQIKEFLFGVPKPELYHILKSKNEKNKTQKFRSKSVLSNRDKEKNKTLNKS